MFSLNFQFPVLKSTFHSTLYNLGGLKTAVKLPQDEVLILIFLKRKILYSNNEEVSRVNFTDFKTLNCRTGPAFNICQYSEIIMVLHAPVAGNTNSAGR
jgi:hypothetical protein